MIKIDSSQTLNMTVADFVVVFLMNIFHPDFVYI